MNKQEIISIYQTVHDYIVARNKSQMYNVYMCIVVQELFFASDERNQVLTDIEDHIGSSRTFGQYLRRNAIIDFVSVDDSVVDEYRLAWIKSQIDKYSVDN